LTITFITSAGSIITLKSELILELFLGVRKTSLTAMKTLQCLDLITNGLLLPELSNQLSEQIAEFTLAS
jgi:hypothetical protein